MTDQNLDSVLWAGVRWGLWRDEKVHSYISQMYFGESVYDEPKICSLIGGMSIDLLIGLLKRIILCQLLR